MINSDASPSAGLNKPGLGVAINCKRVQRLMGIAALGPKPRTKKPAPGHTIYPYLLRELTVERPNQVWAADIT